MDSPLQLVQVISPQTRILSPPRSLFHLLMFVNFTSDKNPSSSLGPFSIAGRPPSLVVFFLLNLTAKLDRLLSPLSNLTLKGLSKTEQQHVYFFQEVFEKDLTLHLNPGSE